MSQLATATMAGMQSDPTFKAVTLSSKWESMSNSLNERGTPSATQVVALVMIGNESSGLCGDQVPWAEYWPLIGLDWSHDLDTGLWLAERGHMTWILASDWLRGITWPRYGSLIGWEGSHDQDTGLWLAVWWPGPMVGDTMKIDRHGPGYLSPGQTLSREKWLTPLRARYYIMWHSCFISLWLEFMPQRGRTSICFDTQK